MGRKEDLDAIREAYEDNWPDAGYHPQFCTCIGCYWRWRDTFKKPPLSYHGWVDARLDEMKPARDEHGFLLEEQGR